MNATDTLRNSDLGTLHTMLVAQHEAKHDVVIPLSTLRVDDDGLVGIPDFDTAPTGAIVEFTRPARIGNIAMGDLANYADVPVKYLRRMHGTDDALFAANLNRWLGVDTRNVLVRSFGDADGGIGFLRAILSDTFAPIDNLDAALATMAGFREAGVQARISSANLSESRMTVVFDVPDVSINIADLVAHYNFKGAAGLDNPIMGLSWVLANSETGGGAFSLFPRAEVKICKNGMVQKQDGFRRIHTGSQLAAGTIKWSEETMSKELQLITSKTKDIITTFSNVEYLTTVADKARTFAALPVSGSKVEATLTVVAKHLMFTEAQSAALFASFFDGGDSTVFGVGQAITAIAQDCLTGEEQADLEANVWDAMAVAAKAAK